MRGLDWLVVWSPSHLFPVRGAEGVKPLKRASLSFRGVIPSKGHGELKEFLTLAGEDQELLSVVGKALDASDKIKAFCLYQRCFLPLYVDKAFIMIFAQWHFSFLLRRLVV